jgi:hypothetical protein
MARHRRPARAGSTPPRRFHTQRPSTAAPHRPPRDLPPLAQPRHRPPKPAAAMAWESRSRGSEGPIPVEATRQEAPASCKETPRRRRRPRGLRPAASSGGGAVDGGEWRRSVRVCGSPRNRPWRERRGAFFFFFFVSVFPSAYTYSCCQLLLM